MHCIISYREKYEIDNPRCSLIQHNKRLKDFSFQEILDFLKTIFDKIPFYLNDNPSNIQTAICKTMLNIYFVKTSIHQWDHNTPHRLPLP